MSLVFIIVIYSQILLTFAFLVIGFALSFMIQFRSQMPFESPWAALVKTMVMMTSEFDYGALFDEEHSKELATSLIIIRVFFLIFLILAAIVLMNLMVGVAVNDINDLEVLGNIRRLVKQVEFLGTLDTLVYNKVFMAMLPNSLNKSIKNKCKVIGVLSLCPGKPRWRHYRILPARLRDAIFDKALIQKKQQDDELNLQMFKSKMDEMYQAIVKKDQPLIEHRDEDRPAKQKLRHEELDKHLNHIGAVVGSMQYEMRNYVQDLKMPIEDLNVKMDQISIEIELMKQVLSRLESKMGAIKT